MASMNRTLLGVVDRGDRRGVGFGSADAGTLDKLKQDKTLRIAYRDDAPPFSFTDATGVPAGFMVDLCRSVAKNLAAALNLGDLKVDYVLVTAANRFDAIETGKADLLCEPTSDTLSRREQVDFSIPTFVDGASLLVSGEGPSDFGALAGKKIGVLAGTTTEQSLRDTLASANINAEVVPAKTHEEGLAMLDQGKDRRLFRRSGHPHLSRLEEQRAGQVATRQQLFLARTVCSGAGARRQRFPPCGRSGAEPDLPLRRDQRHFRA